MINHGAQNLNFCIKNQMLTKSMLSSLGNILGNSLGIGLKYYDCNRKIILTCCWAYSEMLAFCPILSMPSRNIMPRWALARSNSDLRYNLAITELMVSLLSLQPSMRRVRLPRLELMELLDEMLDVRLWNMLRNGGLWISGLKWNIQWIEYNFQKWFSLRSFFPFSFLSCHMRQFCGFIANDSEVVLYDKRANKLT